MSCLLIAYDLNKETQRPKIVEAIKKYPWAMLSESSYAISTNKTPGDVYEGLKGFIDSNDQLYVINLRKPYAGFGPQALNDWLEKNLPG